MVNSQLISQTELRWPTPPPLSSYSRFHKFSLFKYLGWRGGDACGGLIYMCYLYGLTQIYNTSPPLPPPHFHIYWIVTAVSASVRSRLTLKIHSGGEGWEGGGLISRSMNQWTQKRGHRIPDKLQYTLSPVVKNHGLVWFPSETLWSPVYSEPTQIMDLFKSIKNGVPASLYSNKV